MTTFAGHILAADTTSNRPAANTVPAGTLFPSTDDKIVYRSDGSSWANWATLDTPSRLVQIKVFDDATAVATGDGKAIFCIPAKLNGLNLTAAHAYITTVSSSGTPTVQIRNVTDAVDMLSTRITIDVSEFTSYTAAAAPAIDTSHDDVATGDLIAIDVDVAGTGSKGLGVLLTFS